MKLVRVRGTSKRRCEPIVLDIAQFRLLLKELDGPFPQARFQNPEDWMFASPFRAGRTPWDPWSVERRHIIPAAIRCGIGRIGWHSFRHTFRTLLDETGAPMKVQQELMRHADIRTTMNVYGKAMDASKREAHGNVVRMLLAPKVA
jgi:integrase